jgi:WD40 repeat protein
MAPEPERRYPSALALAEDLARYHAHEPILARAAGPWLRARRWTQRNPVAAILLAALALGLVVTGTLLNQIQRSLRRAGSLALAGLAHEVGETDPQAGLAIARKAHARDPSPATLSAVYRALAAAHEERSFRGHDAAVWRTVFSADGHHLASCSDDCTAIVWDTRGEAEPKVLRHGAQVMDIDTDGRRLVTASQDGTVRLFDFDGVAIDRAPLPSRQGGAGHYLRARFAHDAQKVVICSFDGAAWIWDLGQHSLVELVGHRGMVWCGSFSPDDRLVLTAVGYGSEMVQYADDHSARVWDLEGKCLATMNGHEQSLLCAEFSPDCSLVLTGSHDRTLRLWRATGEHLRTFRGHGAAVRCVRFLPGGEHFVSADLDGNVRLWRLDSAEVVATFAHDAAVWSLELSSDGQRILTASWDQTARVHDLRGRLLRTLRGHGSKVKHATWSPDGERIATASYDYTVRLWRASEQDFATHVGHGDGVRSIAVRPDGEGFATGSLDRTVRVWSEEQVRVLATPSPVNRVAYSPSGASLVSVHDDQSGALWSGSGEATARFAGSTRTAFAGVPAWRNASAAFLDGERFLIGSQDASMRLFDAGGTCLRELDAEEVFAQRTGELFDLAAHPGGNHFAAGYWRGDVLVRDLGGGVVARGAPAHSGWVMRVEFSRDGQWLVSASADRTAVLWRWTGGRLERHRTMPHEAAVTWAGFSPDGGRILTTARDGTARLWPLDGGEPLVIRAAADPLWCGAWTHDGRHVLTGAASGLVRRWLVDETRVLELAKERDTRELRPEEQARVESVTR